MDEMYEMEAGDVSMINAVTHKPSRQSDGLAFILATLIFLMLAYLSVARYNAYNAGMFDLGNMSQAVWSVTQGQALMYSRPEGYPASRLAGHMEAFYALLALPYAVLPDPRTLVVIQAAMFGLGGIGAYRLALRRLGERFAARCALLIYLFYPTAISGMLFDIHGDTLALPLLMLALDALDERAWRRFSLLTFLALLCKFYVAASVAGVGAVLMLWPELVSIPSGREWGEQENVARGSTGRRPFGIRRLGLITLLAALTYGAVAFFIIRPLFASQEASTSGQLATSYMQFYFGQLHELSATSIERIVNAVIVFGPAMMLAWRGWRWLLPSLPIALAALLSTGPGSVYYYGYHHFALLVPFLVRAIIDGAEALRDARNAGRTKRRWQGDLGFTAAIVLLCGILLNQIPLNPLFWQNTALHGFHNSSYGVTARDTLKDQFLSAIPAHAPVASSVLMASHLANRDTLYVLRYPNESEGPRLLPKLLPQVDYVVSDAIFDYYVPLGEGHAGGVDGDREALALVLADPAFQLTRMRDGLLLFERNASPAQGLKNSITSLADDGSPAIGRVGDALDLLRSEVTDLGGGRIQLRVVWRVRAGFGKGRFMAITRLGDLEGVRFVHLPSYVLRPAWEWKAGEVIEERMEIALPEELPSGSYTLMTGWYDIDSPYAEQSDARSRLPASEEIPLGDIVK